MSIKRNTKLLGCRKESPEHIRGQLSAIQQVCGCITDTTHIFGDLSSRVEIDPTVPSWAKQPNPPAKILSDTVIGWNSQRDLIAEANTIYVYIDYMIYTEDSDESSEESSEVIYYPGIKFGDGKAYLIDIPYANPDYADILWDHIHDQVRHITASEREFWNNKNRAYAIEDNEELVLTKF